MKSGPSFKTDGFLFDLNACTGCNACQLACSIENDLDWQTSWRQVLTFNPGRLPAVPTYHLSLACHHCAEAPCIQQCPALAITRNPQTGAVLIDAQSCIGCRYCSWVCPYEAPTYDEQQQIMTKCTGCHHRLLEGQEPACVQQCPTGALEFGPLHGDQTVAGFPDTPAQPAIRFQPLQRPPLETSWQPPETVWDSFELRAAKPASKIALGSEWPLLVFTLITAGLAGWMIAAALGLQQVSAPWFAALAGLATVTSTLHLGRKRRAWRAILNLKHSWLSREIAAFGAFAATSMAAILAAPEVPAAQAGAALLGLAASFCADRVYDPVRPAGLPLHSADTLLTSLLFATLLAAGGPAFGLIAGVKLFLYLHRREHRVLDATGFLVPAGRIGIGLLLPAATLLLSSGTSLTFPLAAAAIGEVIDRAQFYTELEPVSPRREITRALASGLKHGF